MPYSSIFSTEQKKDSPILIIDKKAIIGSMLAEKLSLESVIVLVSDKQLIKNENIIHVFFGKGTPTIPDNIYSYIIVIDENLQLNNNFLNNIFKKALKNNTGVFLGINHKNINENIFRKIVLKYPNLKLGLFGDIFAKNFIYSNQNDINKIIIDASSNKKILIPSESNEELVPVLIDDVVLSIIKICFSLSKDKIYYIHPKTPITFLTLSTYFKKNFPEIKLDFYKSKTISRQKKLILKGNYILGDGYKLSDRIADISFEKIAHNPKREKIKKEKGASPIFFTVLFFLMLLIMPLLTPIVFRSIGELLIEKTEIYLKNGNNKTAHDYAYFSDKILFVAYTSSYLLRQETGILGNNNLIVTQNLKITDDYDKSNAYLDLSNFLSKLNALIRGNSNNPQQDLNTAISSLINLSITYGQGFENQHDISNKIKNIFTLTSSTTSFWSELLGFNTKKLYLIYIEDLKKEKNLSDTFYLLEVRNGKITEKQLNVATSSSVLKMAKDNNVNGIFMIDKLFVSGLKTYINKNDFISLSLLNFLSNSLEEKHLILNFDNILIQNAFSSSLN